MHRQIILSSMHFYQRSSDFAFFFENLENPIHKRLGDEKWKKLKNTEKSNMSIEIVVFECTDFHSRNHLTPKPKLNRPMELHAI